MHHQPLVNIRTDVRTARGFTLTELIVSVVVLIGVLLAASRIFGTTQEVAGVGEANSEVIDELSLIESKMRDDLALLARDGVFLIRNIEVPNNIRGAGLPLVNQNLPVDAVVRADQLVFFRGGVQGAKTLRVGAGEKVRPAGNVHRVYYGHGFQLGEAARPAIVPNSGEEVRGWDVVDQTNANVHRGYGPWYSGPIDVRSFNYGGSNILRPVGGIQASAIVPRDASGWSFLRDSIAMVTDDLPGAPLDNVARSVYLDDGGPDYGGALSIFSLFADDLRPELAGYRTVLAGRGDAANTTMGNLRQQLTLDSTGITLPWRDGLNDSQWTRITNNLIGALPAISAPDPNELEYPRAERRAPSMSRVDQALTNSILGTGISDVRFDWTWRDGTGAVLDASNLDNPGLLPVQFTGFTLEDPAGFSAGTPTGQPWFGLADADTGVRPVSERFHPVTNDAQWSWDGAILDPTAIEAFDGTALPTDGNIRTYTAAFGYNVDRPLESLGSTGTPVPPVDVARWGFTPWPDAIRVTLTLHDVAGRLGQGRTVQFIIDLPEPGSDG
ncbi:MAG: type II secretion system protein J [Phycisphaerales bacterium]